MKILENTIELLKYIKTLIHEPEWSNYLFTSITEVFKRVFNMNQKYNKSLLDYSKLLKKARGILELHFGKDIMGHYIENLEEFKNA